MSDDRQHILLVEDEEAHVELVEMAFEDYGDRFSLAVVKTVQGALDYLTSTLPYLVITDFLLPDGKGIELVAIMKSKHPDIPVVMMTSHGDEQVAVDAMKAGAMDYLVKSEVTLMAMPRVAARVLREHSLVTAQQKTEKKLEESEEKYRIVFEQSIDAVIIIDSNDRYIDCNQAALDMFGCSRKEEVLNKSPWEIAPEIQPNGLFSASVGKEFHQSALARGSARFEWYKKRMDNGLVFPVEASLTAIPYQGGKVLYAVLRDITERKKAETILSRHLQFLQVLMDSIPVPVFHKDSQGIYTGCNKAFEAFLGKKREEIIGRTVYEISPGDLAKTYHEKDLELIQRGGNQIYDFRVMYADRTQHDVIFHKAVLTKKTGEPEGLIGVMLDITERKQSEKEIKQLNEELEQRVQERTQELEKSFEKLQNMQNRLILQEKMASLGTLTAGISHEIKNPLNFVNNFSELVVDYIDTLSKELKKEVGDQNEEEIQQLLDIISRSGKKIHEHGNRANDIIESMLLHSRGGSGEFQKTDINAILSEYIGLVYHSRKAKDQNFTVMMESDLDDSLEHIKTVAQDISRVFVNLLNNALDSTYEKFLEQDGEYAPVVYTSTRDLEDRIEIKIRDNGKGISPQHMTKIFEPFFTTKQGENKIGLGLPLSYDIVTQEHQGTMHVESEEGKFSEFTVTLPKLSNTA
ncbi:MAG: PAS domain S-box protein [SAR324 cluster bacterium]|nr:PAS domain S-box protein [SAR324 cluster bacterium]